MNSRLVVCVSRWCILGYCSYLVTIWSCWLNVGLLLLVTCLLHFCTCVASRKSNPTHTPISILLVTRCPPTGGSLLYSLTPENDFCEIQMNQIVELFISRFNDYGSGSGSKVERERMFSISKSGRLILNLYPCAHIGATPLS